MPHAEILQRCMSASDGDIEAAFEAFKYIMSNKLDAYVASTEAAAPAALAVEANSDGIQSTIDRAERTIERLTAMLEESVQSARSAALSEESPPRDPETGLFVDKTGKNRTHCTYEDGDGCWTVADVVEYVEDHKIPATLCDVRALCDANPATGDESGEDCDPILVVEYTDRGPSRVCEGVHRLWKARSEGATKVRAHVITKYELDKIPHEDADPSADGKHSDPYQSSMTFPVMHDVAAPFAHDVSSEARDQGGKWTNGGGKPDPKMEKEVAKRLGKDGLDLIKQLREEVRGVYGTELGVCKKMSTQIEVELGIKGVIGVRGGKEHHWNEFEDGTILDASADQYGDAPLAVVKPTDPLYKEYKRSSGKRAPSAPMAVGVEPEDNPEERAQLISEILVMLFEDSAIEVADELHHHQGSGHLDDTAEETPDTSMAFAPKVTRRYGKRPGPGWSPGGTSRLGTPIWIWGAAPTGGGAPPPTPAPAHAPTPTPAPAHHAPPPPTPAPAHHAAPTPAPVHHAPPTPAPHAPPPAPAAPTHNLPMATVPPGALGARGGVGAKAASIEAYNQIAQKLNAGQQITNADKAMLAKKLTNMPVDLLRNLHKAFGGTAAVANQKAAVAAVRAHLTGGGTMPTPAPTPPPNPLHKGANVIGGAPAGPTPGSVAPPQHYQPPPPKLVAAKPYVATVGKVGAAAAPFPATIDHNTVSGFLNSVSAMSPDFSPLLTGSSYGYGHIGQLDHLPSGYKAIATWSNTYGGISVPPAGSPGLYKIQVLDGTGSIVSTYDSQAPRDKAYVEQRLAQVANWMEQQVKTSTTKSTQPTWSAPLAQFAWDYANAAGVKPGTVPFKIDAASAGDPKNRAAMEGYLKTTFPKLIGAQQHSPHGGMDTIEHTMNILNPLNLRTSGLSNRDAEILRLGMLFHDVGKQHDPKDHDHPRLSAKDAEPMLWQFGLNEREVSDCLAVIKWHDSYGDAMQGRSGYADAGGIAKMAYEYTDDTLPPAQRQKEAHRINDLLMRAFQSDVSSIPGLTSKPIPGRPDLTPSGWLDVDKSGPAFKAKIEAEINKLASAGTYVAANVPMKSLPKSLPLPKQPPNLSVGIGPKPDLVAKGLKWGELVQRADQLPIGPQVPHGSTIEPPKEVYDEARKNPDLNYARAFNMAYDGPAGSIVNVYHGTRTSAAAPILSTGVRPGSNGDNVFGHGVYVVVNGAHSVPSAYSNGATVQMEVHTGRTISHDDLERKILPQWEKAHPTEAKQLGKSSYGYNNSNNEHLTAAALWAGYSSIAVNYSYGNPTLVVIDPSRVRVKNIVDDKKYKSMTVKATHGTVTSQSLTPADIKTTAGDVNYIPLKSGVPQAWSGTPRTK